MIMLWVIGNYMLSRIWDGLTITIAISITGVETSSNEWDGWCGSQPMPSIIFTPLSITLTMIHHQNTSVPKSTPKDLYWESSVRKANRGWWFANQSALNTQSGYKLILLSFLCDGKHSLKCCWWQRSVFCIYDIWQSIYEDLPNALNTQHLNGHPPANSNQEWQYSW